MRTDELEICAILRRQTDRTWMVTECQKERESECWAGGLGNLEKDRCHSLSWRTQGKDM